MPLAQADNHLKSNLFIDPEGLIPFFQKVDDLCDSGHAGIDIGLGGLGTHFLGGKKRPVPARGADFVLAIRGQI